MKEKEIQQGRIVIITIVLFVIALLTGFFLPMSLFTEDRKAKYELVSSFYNSVSVQCWQGDNILVVNNYFLYDNTETNFNVDLVVCSEQTGHILYIMKLKEVNGKAIWQKSYSMPDGLPIEEIITKSRENFQERELREKLKKEEPKITKSKKYYIFHQNHSRSYSRACFCCFVD